MWDLTGRTALVSDVSFELGGAIAWSLAQAGAFVLIKHGRRSIEARLLVEEIRRHGGSAEGIRSDRQGRFCAATFAVRAREITGRGVDILVQRFGLALSRDIDAATVQRFDRMLATNLSAPCRLLDEVIPALEPGASIVLVPPLDDRAARDQVPAEESFAIDPFVRQLSSRLGSQEIRVNAVSAQDMPIHGVGRGERSGRGRASGAQARDIAAAVTFLASRCSRWVNGKVISVDAIIGL